VTRLGSRENARKKTGSQSACRWGTQCRSAADSALSEQQRRQFFATAARVEWRFRPQPRRKSCNGL